MYEGGGYVHVYMSIYIICCMQDFHKFKFKFYLSHIIIQGIFIVKCVADFE